MILDLKEITIFDIDGYPRIIKGCPAFYFGKLKSLYEAFWVLCMEIDPELQMDFFSICARNEKVIKVTFTMSKILGLKPKKLDMETIAALFYSYTDKEDQPHKGLIWEKYFSQKETTKDGISWDEYFYLLIASLSTSEGGIEKATELSKTLSVEEIEGVLTKRNEIYQKQDKNNPANKLAELRKKKEEYKKKFGNVGFAGVTRT